jgi:hypothetical protein
VDRRACRWVFIAAVAVLQAACVPPSSAGPSGPEASATATSASGSTAAPTLPLVIDTDMAPDDITAIASLLRDPAVEIRAITVTGTGEAHCPGGLFVARSVVSMLVDRPIPSRAAIHRRSRTRRSFRARGARRWTRVVASSSPGPRSCLTRARRRISWSSWLGRRQRPVAG